MKKYLVGATLLCAMMMGGNALAQEPQKTEPQKTEKSCCKKGSEAKGDKMMDKKACDKAGKDAKACANKGDKQAKMSADGKKKDCCKAKK